MANNNINLLPEDMRERERKEAMRAANRPKVFTVELSPVGKAKPPVPIQPPKESLWAKIFGSKRKVKTRPLATGMKMPQYGPRVDMLETAKKQNVKYTSQSTPPLVISKPKKSF